MTSRESLHVRGEHLFAVQPLALPDPGHLPDDETIMRYGAIALFLERAREVNPPFQVTPQQVPLIAEICRRLDGLPLAIELAVARLKVLSLPSLLERLEHGLAVLTGAHAMCLPGSPPCAIPSPGATRCSQRRNSSSSACLRSS